MKTFKQKSYAILFAIAFIITAPIAHAQDERFSIEDAKVMESKLSGLSRSELIDRQDVLLSEAEELKLEAEATQSPSKRQGLLQRLSLVERELSMIEKIAAGITAAVLIENLQNDPYNDTFPPVITLNGSSSVTIELGATYVDAGASAMDAHRGVTSVSVSGSVNTSAVGTYTLTYTATDLDNNTATATRTVTVVDTTAPVIQVTGDNPVTHELGGTYTDAGATATDASGSATVTSNGTVNKDAVGSYEITYVAIDASGNTSTATRTVNVVDTTAPVVTVAGDNPATVELGDTYTDAGATATDASGTVTVVTTGTVDTDTVGTYTLTYTSTDASDNAGTATRTVNVVDTTAPVVTVTGDNPATHELGDTYTDAGATATDLSGDVTVVTTGTVDADTVGAYTLTYTSTDASDNAGTATRTVNVVDTTAPVFTSSASMSADENQTAVGTAVASDLSSVTYTISGSDLEITSAGVITFASAPDYETQTSYSATVTATDAYSNATTQDITVSVNNLNDNTPVISSVAVFEGDENQTSVTSTAGTDVVATDADGDTLTYTLSGTNANYLQISSSGVISYKTAPDAENMPAATPGYHVVDLKVSDGTYYDTQRLNIYVRDVNDNAPVITSVAIFEGDENQTSLLTTAGTNVTATDADSTSTVTYSLSGDDAYLFNISAGGVLSYAVSQDAENMPAAGYHVITVTATDGTYSDSQLLNVYVRDVNDNSPVLTSSAVFTGDENQTSVTATDGNSNGLTASDADSTATLTYSLSGEDASLFNINSSTGVITYKTAPDAENDDVNGYYTATATVSDGVNTDSGLINIYVIDVNDNSPVITSSSIFTGYENETVITSTDATPASGIVATDADADATLTYTLSGDDASLFNIDSSTGIITYKTAPDAENADPVGYYEMTASVSDGSNSDSTLINVYVLDVNEAPEYTSSASFTADENQTSIGTVTVDEPDVGDTVTFSISGSEITINSSSGVLEFVSAPDYEVKSTYTATVTVTDGFNSPTQEITVTINDVGGWDDDPATGTATDSSGTGTGTGTSSGSGTSTGTGTSSS